MSFIPVYILILFFTIVIDYFAGIYLERTNGPNRKLLLVVSLLSNILILCFFKYYYFLNDNLTVKTGKLLQFVFCVSNNISFHGTAPRKREQEAILSNI